MKQYATEQEAFWAGDFGNEYVARNCDSEKFLASRLAFWSKILQAIPEKVSSCLEFGTNIGMNLKALGLLVPELQMNGIEINETAAKKCAKLPRVKVHHGSILEFETDAIFDLTFTCGVLIHINPEALPVVYDKLYQYSKKYIAITEYYNPTPVTVNYRGNEDRLFKRDFAGELINRFPDLRLIDYGFVYHRDCHFPFDDGTWFVMEKN